MWNTKLFKSRQAMQAWVHKYQYKYQWNEIFVNNAYGIEYKPFRVINIL